jgi:hypothetical protein
MSASRGDPHASATADVPVPQQPTPGDGGTPVMVMILLQRDQPALTLGKCQLAAHGSCPSCCPQEQQQRNWSLSPQQAPTAAKRLGKRVQRKVSSMSKSAVRRIRHPISGSDNNSEAGSSSASEDLVTDSEVSEDTEVEP